MKRLISRSFLTDAIFLGAVVVAGANSAYGDSFLVSFLASGVQTPAGVTTHYASFNSISPGASNLPYVTTFGNSGYTGTYSGAVQWYRGDQYGGAGGTGTYPETFGSYSVTINPSVNYFGLWFSALDAGNQLKFYRDSTLVYSFTPHDFITLVGACPGNAFCGNPNTNFQGSNVSQQYAYLNFYDNSNTFNRVVFTETSGGGFESDNHAVAVINTAPGGTLIGTPEPPSLGLLLLAATLLGTSQWRRHQRVSLK